MLISSDYERWSNGGSTDFSNAMNRQYADNTMGVAGVPQNGVAFNPQLYQGNNYDAYNAYNRAVGGYNNAGYGGAAAFQGQMGFPDAAGIGANGEGISKVFVSNLSDEVKWQDLKDHFKQVGPVLRADVIYDQSRRSKGCGIVEFPNPYGAAVAMQRLQGSLLCGRAIQIREDREAGKPRPAPVAK